MINTDHDHTAFPYNIISFIFTPIWVYFSLILLYIHYLCSCDNKKNIKKNKGLRSSQAGTQEHRREETQEGHGWDQPSRQRSQKMPEKIVNIDHAENIYVQTGENLPPSPVSAIPGGVEEYLRKLAEKYNRIPTILFREPLTPFREYYVPNDVQWHESIQGQRNNYHVRTAKGGKISKLLNISQHLILSGTGGLGKSMMMRNFLLTSVDEYEKNGRIPFFIPLKDYNPTCSSMLDYVFAAVKDLWLELSIEGLDFILKEGKGLLLFDGLDEIHSSQLADFTKKMNSFQDRYSRNAFIISSRPYSNFQSFTHSTVLYLKPFSLPQSLDMVDRYNYRADAPNMQARFRYELEHVLFKSHTTFCTNPLLLSIMMLTFEMDAEVPLEKYLFYQEAYTVLSRRHDALKDGYRRKLETGWNANQFADYFAYFCAKTYEKGLVSFSYPEMDHYFHMLVRKYDIKGVGLDDFIHDLINNLCLMYQDGPKYGFINRSFQEYFCAKYFNAQLDELLVHIIPMFDRDDRTKKEDSAIEMLFDMKPSAVEKYLILPYLKGLIADCEAKDGIWTFLDRLYDNYEMADGDAWADEDNCKPHSNLYAFILDHYEVPLLCPSSEDYPGISHFIQDTLVYREDTHQDEWKNDLPSDYEYYYGEPEVTGHLFVINWSIVRRDYARYPTLLEGFIPAVEDPGKAFMAEYNAVKKLALDLEKKLEEKTIGTDFFDLME